MTAAETAEQLARLAADSNCTWRTSPYTRGILARIDHLNGAGCWIDLPDAAVPCYVIGWNSKIRRLSAGFATYRDASGFTARTRCFSGQGLLAVVKEGLAKIADGTAFEPCHRAHINTTHI